MRNCLSLLKINEGVVFDENLGDKVYLIFVLGAVSNRSHIDILLKLMEIIDNHDMVQRLIDATSIATLIEILQEVI